MLRLLLTYKKESRSYRNNYRPFNILDGFSKIYERFINDKLLNHVNDILSDFVSAYQNKYSSNHMILRLFEEWKEKLDKEFFAGAVLMDLSKAFDCIHHDLLIATILRPLLFKIFINDLIGFVIKVCICSSKNLRNEAGIAIQWFNDDFMIVNPGKFQAMVINRFGKMENKHEMYIENKKITSEHSVKSLGNEITKF